MSNQDALSVSQPHSIPAAKLAVLSRFNSMRETITSSVKSKKVTEFPPPSWTLQDTQNNGAGASAWSYDPNLWTKEIEQLKEIRGGELAAEEDGQGTSGSKIKSASTSGPANAKDLEPEPITLANRIRALISGLPLFDTANKAGPSQPVVDNTNARANEQAVDPKLAILLSSESVMNGETSIGKQSVWSILESLGPKRNQKHQEERSREGDGDGDGIMVYAPLQPDSGSEVELADSDIILDNTEDSALKPEHAHRQEKASEGIPSGGETIRPKTNSHREWHPSPTKLSLQATWWGYRLYIPPPVLDVLSDAHLAAAKRGALVTAALKWLLDKIPMMMVPPQLRPGVMVLKRLTPYLGYVGASVAWSWERIKKRDKGMLFWNNFPSGAVTDPLS